MMAESCVANMKTEKHKKKNTICPSVGPRSIV